MARRPRHFIQGMPYHLVQRGNNRQPCFMDVEDRLIYLGLWKVKSAQYGLPVHAYCLMSNHVHILCSNISDGCISRTVKTVNGTYAIYMNRKYSRTGTLWEGRFWSSLIQTRRYLLACYRYIELNPVRARLVSKPEDYPWSSHLANAMGKESWIEPHDEFESLGSSPATRRIAYRRLFGHPLDEDLTTQFRSGLRHSLPVGDDNFVAAMKEQLGLPAGDCKPGRPRRKPASG
jgi:putative transposase